MDQLNEKGLEEFLGAVNHYSIGGQHVRVESFGLADAAGYLRALKHLEIPSGEPDITIKLIGSGNTGFRPPSEWLNWDEIDPYNGELLNFDKGYSGVFNTNEPSFILIDHAAGLIRYWVDDFTKLPPNETAAPLRAVFYHWFKNTPFFLCHAAGLGLGEKGTILTGKSGSGKSTSTLACLGSDLRYAGDDFLLVDSENCIAYSLYGVAKLNTDQFGSFEHLREHISNVEHMPKEKGHVYISEEFGETMINRFSVKSILLPVVTGKPGSYIESCSKLDALMALVPSSVWIIRSDTRSVEKMKKFISRVPSFKLFAGTDLTLIPHQIMAHLHES